MKKPVTPRLRIAVVDNHELTRDALARLCADWPHGEAVLKACDGVDYEEQLATVGAIDLVVVELQMPRRDGYETMKWVREHQPEVLILVISYSLTDDMVYHALQAGANAAVEQSIVQADLMACLESLRTTGYYTTPMMMRQLDHKPDPNSLLALRKKLTETLSPRELVYLNEYIKEVSPSRKSIAGTMNVKPSTAESLRKNISAKTGARTRLGMFIMAVRFGLVKV